MKLGHYIKNIISIDLTKKSYFSDPQLFDDPQPFDDLQLFDDPQLFDDQLEVWTLIIQKSTVIPPSLMVLLKWSMMKISYLMWSCILKLNTLLD